MDKLPSKSFRCAFSSAKCSTFVSALIVSREASLRRLQFLKYYRVCMVGLTERISSLTKWLMHSCNYFEWLYLP